MPKFNKSLARLSQTLTVRKRTTTNRAGGLAFMDTPRMALYRQVATSLWSGDGYYERHAEWLQRFRQNVADALTEDAHFPFALAAYARDKRGLGLRSSPLGLYVEAVAHPASKGTGFARQYAPRVLLRADEPAEAIAYFKTHHQGVVPHGLLRGIADTLPNFDEYQLAKYKDTGSVSLRDVFRLARPKPRDGEQRALWERVVSGSLETPYTWEVELSQATTDEAKREKWNELIASGKLGLFALVRNIRNIIKYRANIEEALDQVSEDRVKGSGILPFQWYKAYKAIAAAAGKALAQPMEQALTWSLADVPRLPGITLVACDNSGSMSHSFPSRDTSLAEISNLMGAMALSVCEQGVAGTFGDTFALADTHPRDSLFHNKFAIDVCGGTTGNSTNAWRVFETLTRERIGVHRVILLSDMQCYDSNKARALAFASRSLSAELDGYLRINPECRVYSINMASQDNTSQFAPEQPVIELAGWSESIFQFISAIEAGEDRLQLIAGEY